MSIAEGVLDIALDYAKKNNATVIREIGLKLGEMTGVVIDSLRSWGGASNAAKNFTLRAMTFGVRLVKTVSLR